MPEGDTIFRSAATLREALAGRRLLRFEAPRLVGRAPRPGALVDDVEPRGKHLLVHFSATERDPALTLRTHLRMTGSWHVYRPGERWWKPRHRARAVIEVEDTVAVCFSAPVVDVIPTARIDDRRDLSSLGPDLCHSDADVTEVLRRLDRLPPETEIGDALLDQRIAAGVGNIYKSEVLHACRVHPTTPLGDLDRPARRTLVETASRLLRANLSGYPRRTVPGGLGVYGRRGAPCRRCGATITAEHQGEHARITFWCPSCQGEVIDGG